MREFRLDPTTNEWVIIASERAKRPSDLAGREEARSVPDFVEDCPFCLGNEDMTPREVAIYREESDPLRWKVRVVPNKFPALQRELSLKERLTEGHFKAMDAFGFHEVVIESPIHSRTMYKMETNEIQSIIQMYRDRYESMFRDPRIRLVVMFKNHGLTAGTSLEHPHSQIVATPIVPAYVRRKRQLALEHYRETNNCLYCDINEWEIQSNSRVVLESDFFVVFHPFASHYPFETWISPKRHNASFSSISPREIQELGKVLQETVVKMGRALGEVDFNYILHMPPVEDEHKEFLHWYVQMVPRTWISGGFEIGSGIQINTSIPEETAQFMRET